MLRKIRIGLGVVYVLPLAILGVASMLEERPDYIGLGEDGTFRDCELGLCDSPFSWYKDVHHPSFVLDVEGRGVALDEALPMTCDVIDSLPFRARVQAEGDYLHVELSNSILGFVNDLEVRLDRERGVLCARSASRTGIEHGFSMDNFHARLIGAAARLRKSRAD